MCYHFCYWVVQVVFTITTLNTDSCLSGTDVSITIWHNGLTYDTMFDTLVSIEISAL